MRGWTEGGAGGTEIRWAESGWRGWNRGGGGREQG